MTDSHADELHRLHPRVQRPGTSEVELTLVPGQLAVGFLLDTPMGWREVDRELLHTWGMTASELIIPALDNLRRLSSVHSWVAVETVPGVHVYHAADGMAASRVLVLDSLLEPLPADGVVVAVPSPDQLLCVPLDGPAAIEALPVVLASAGVAIQATSEPLSDQAYWFDGTWLRPLQVQHTEDGVEAHLPEELKDALHRLSMLIYLFAAEA